MKLHDEERGGQSSLYIFNFHGKESKMFVSRRFPSAPRGRPAPVPPTIRGGGVGGRGIPARLSARLYKINSAVVTPTACLFKPSGTLLYVRMYVG